MKNLLVRSQLKVGLYLMDTKHDVNIPRKILEILPETPEAWGQPSIVLVEWTGNVPQRISWSTITEWKIFDPDQEPEYLL